jgi:hypothetical protein
MLFFTLRAVYLLVPVLNCDTTHMIWGSHSVGYEEFCLLGYNVVMSRRKMSLPSSGTKIIRAQNQRQLRWQEEFCLTFTFNGLHSVIILDTRWRVLEISFTFQPLFFPPQGNSPGCWLSLRVGLDKVVKRRAPAPAVNWTSVGRSYNAWPNHYAAWENEEGPDSCFN